MSSSRPRARYSELLGEQNGYGVGQVDLLELRLLLQIATRVSSWGACTSATRPDVKRETKRSGMRCSCCGYLSLVTTMGTPASCRALKCVEELFLRLLAAGQELNVVHQEHVAVAAVTRAGTPPCGGSGALR